MVDGVERPIATLVNEEIESVIVLKDAAALAMYGMRGANGVMLITTKQGTYNQYDISVSYDQSVNTAFRIPEFLDGYNYARTVNEASILDGNPVVYSQKDLADFQTGDSPFYPSVDWFDEAFRDFGSTSNFNAIFRGGGKAARFFVMLNYQEERGLFDNTDLDERYDSQLKYERINFRSNLDIDLTGTTSFKLNIAGEIVDNQRPDASVPRIMNALYNVPSGVFPVRSINNYWGGTDYYGNNPVALIAATGQHINHSTNLSTTASLQQDLSNFLKGLSTEVSVAYDQSPTFYERKSKGFVYESMTVSRDPVTGEIIDTSLVLYGSEADFVASHGLAWQRREAAGWGKINYQRRIGQGYLNSSILYNIDMRVYTGQYNTYRTQNLSAFVSYSNQQKYFIDFSLTYGGNSLLPEKSRFGLFPAISGAWIVSEESFLKDNDLISSLKIRASWGISGNGAVPANLYEQKFISSGTYYFTDNLGSYGGYREGRLATPFMTYEKAKKFNTGFDFELMRKLNITADLFYEKRSNLLTSTDAIVSNVLGVSTAYNFTGKVENKGIDASLIWNDELGDFRYFIGANFLFARNKILEMNEQFRPYDYLRRTGMPVNQQFGLETIGFFADEEDIANSPAQVFCPVKPGDIKYRDQNDDGVINEYDVIPVGYASNVPEIYYSANLGFEYKGFGIEVLFQGIAHQTDYLNTRSVFRPLVNQNSITTNFANRWTPETAETATLPRLTMLENENNYRKNDIWLTDVSYLKLRYLEVYYKFPESLLNKIKTKSLTTYLRGSNLFSIDKVNVVDPEATGVTYPTLTSYHVGIKVGF
jgi:TonB-linked SusC/RagA family outer membrane protein